MFRFWERLLRRHASDSRYRRGRKATWGWTHNNGRGIGAALFEFDVDLGNVPIHHRHKARRKLKFRGSHLHRQKVACQCASQLASLRSQTHSKTFPLCTRTLSPCWIPTACWLIESGAAYHCVAWVDSPVPPVLEIWRNLLMSEENKQIFTVIRLTTGMMTTYLVWCAYLLRIHSIVPPIYQQSLDLWRKSIHRGSFRMQA